jgi:hypothetical protein
MISTLVNIAILLTHSKRGLAVLVGEKLIEVKNRRKAFRNDELRWFSLIFK